MLELTMAGKKKPKKRASNNLLMHFDGVSGSKVFVDEYPNNGLILPLGNPILTNEQLKFGPTSGKFMNESLALELPIVLAGDYTISGWIRLLAFPGSGTVLSLVCDETTPGQPGFSPLAIMMGGGTTYLARWISYPLNTWGHFETSRQGNTYRNFFNGKLTQELTTTIPKNNKITHMLHHNAVASRLKGYVDEVQVLDGIATHTADFTPPTAPFTI